MKSCGKPTKYLSTIQQSTGYTHLFLGKCRDSSQYLCVCTLLTIFKELPHTLSHLILKIILCGGRYAWNKWPVFLNDDYLASHLINISSDKEHTALQNNQFHHET